MSNHFRGTALLLTGIVDDAAVRGALLGGRLMVDEPAERERESRQACTSECCRADDVQEQWDNKASQLHWRVD